MLIKKQNGFTLVELLIALAINTFLISALITVFVTNLDHYNHLLKTAQLNEQLQSAMQIMSSEIRRAGYWTNARNDIGTNQNNNPFMASGTDISVTGSNCILFTYDKNNDGTLPSVGSGSDDERYGFRLSGTTLQARPPGATFNCSAAANNWENMTDATVISITALTFSLTSQTITTGPGSRGITIRSVDISLTGQLASDASISKTLTQHIRIRNDKFTP